MIYAYPMGCPLIFTPGVFGVTDSLAFVSLTETLRSSCTPDFFRDLVGLRVRYPVACPYAGVVD